MLARHPSRQHPAGESPVETNRSVTRRSSLTPRGRRSGGFSGSVALQCAAGSLHSKRARVVAPVAQQARAMPRRSLWRWRFVSARVRANESLARAGGLSGSVTDMFAFDSFAGFHGCAGYGKEMGNPRTVGRAA